MILKSKIKNPKSKINPNDRNEAPRALARGPLERKLKRPFFILALKGKVFWPRMYKRSAWDLAFGIWCFFVIWDLAFGISALSAQELTILYTGDTHAMIYPCNCPKEPDGGIARRAALIKGIRDDHPDTLLLDSGGFFAGGLLDEYTQNVQLDTQRNRINLRALELMKYDALAIGDDEFNFGKEFLEEYADRGTLPFISCNIKSDKIAPYIIKEVSGMKIGIIGATNLAAAQKTAGTEFLEPKIAVKKAVAELKRKRIDIIILLSHLGEGDDLALIDEVRGIDIVIIGHARSKDETFSKIGSTLVLRPEWQGRKLGRLSLTITDNKITDYKVEAIRLSDKINDDPEVFSILPQCFSDLNCKKGGLAGTCLHPGSPDARCIFSPPKRVDLLIITPEGCVACDAEKTIGYLKTQFAGLDISYLYYPDAQANKIIKELNLNTLPAYLLEKGIEKEKGFNQIKNNIEARGNFYILKPEFAGVSYFLERRKIKGKLDVFLSLYDDNISELLNNIKDFQPDLHFLALEKENKFSAAKGRLEVEEYLRAACVKKYYPAYSWDYIACRAKNMDTSWWQDCLPKADTNKIKICAQGQEGRDLLRTNTSLGAELKIMFGTTCLLDNQEIFSFSGAPKKEDLEKIFKR